MTVTLMQFSRLVEAAIDRELPLKLEEDTHLYDDIGMDSMAAVVLVVELQREFGIRVPDEEVPNLLTAGAFLKYVNSHRD